MKSRGIIFLYLCAFACLLSCTKDSAGPRMCELSVSCGNGGKISISGESRTVWGRDDALSVFYGCRINRRWSYKGEDGASCGRIEGPAEGSLKDGVVALYPFNDRATLRDGIINTVLNSEQTFRSGSYSAKDVVMYATGNTGQLNFGYAVSLAVLRLGVVGSCEVESVEFSSVSRKDVAGNMTISAPDGTVSVSGHDTIRMRYGKVITESAPESFFFCIAPGEYESGIQFKVRTGGGEDRIVRYTSPVSLKGGDMLVVEDIYSSASSVTIDLSANNSFSPNLPGSSFKGEGEYTLETEDFGPLTFVISDTAGGFYHTGTSLRLNNGVENGNAYIRIPIPSGHVLSQIFLTIDNQSSKSFKLGTGPGLADICDSQSVPTGVKKMISVDYRGKYCYLCTSGKNAQIVGLELVYN